MASKLEVSTSFRQTFFESYQSVIRIHALRLLAPGACFEFTRQQRLESVVGRPMSKPKRWKCRYANFCRADLVQVIWSRQMPGVSRGDAAQVTFNA